ncbi:MAG: CpXC domain-containing protein [Anaerolineales bacterium]|nr:CpXC domain-containing protein [Anaerolineales bacterium]
MPQSQISCPRCRQMIPAQVEQLFDVTAEPAAKQRLLGRVSNYARCQFCGFEGPLSTPIVYHDNEKELLLTFFPSELGLPVNEQEKLVGPLISKVMDRLPAEKRKGYLLRPQSFLTYQSMIERILEADGVTKEMLDSQQKRIDLIQHLIQTTTPEVRADMIKENAALLDEAFFGLFNRLVEAAMQSGQQPTAEAMSALQEELLDGSEYGRQLKEQFEEIQAAVKTLQDVGEGLTREKLLEIFISAPSDARLKALVSMTRNGLDYSFFQVLTERIDKATPDERVVLEALREKLLDLTNQMDKALEAQMKAADEFIEQILTAPAISQVVTQNLEQFNNEAIAQVLESKMREATQNQDNQRLQKIQQIVMVLQQASTPPELELVQALVDAPDEAAMEKMLAENEAMISDELGGMIGSLMTQMEQQQPANPEAAALLSRLELVYRMVVKYQMKKNMGK